MRHGPSLVRRPSLSLRISQFPSTFAFEASSPKQHKNPSSFFSSPPTAADRGFLRSEAGIVFCIVAPRFFIFLIAQRVVLQLYLVLHCHTFPLPAFQHTLKRRSQKSSWFLPCTTSFSSLLSLIIHLFPHTSLLIPRFQCCQAFDSAPSQSFRVVPIAAFITS